MTRRNEQIKQARCMRCGHDLHVPPRETQGRVFCTNPRCGYRNRPHPTGKTLNAGPSR